MTCVKTYLIIVVSSWLNHDPGGMMGLQSGGKSEATMVWGVGVWNIYIEINREKNL